MFDTIHIIASIVKGEFNITVDTPSRYGVFYFALNDIDGMVNLIKPFDNYLDLNLIFILTLPTSDKSYLSLSKKRLLNRDVELSTVGGSPGLNIL